MKRHKWGPPVAATQTCLRCGMVRCPDPHAAGFIYARPPGVVEPSSGDATKVPPCNPKESA